MRKSRNGQRRAFAAFTKFSVLLMCFAVVFALVLTTGVLDGDMSYDANGNANVAEASISGGSTTALDTSMRFDMGDFHAEYGKNPNASSLQFTMRLDEYISAGNSDALSAYTSLYGWTDASVSVEFWNDYNNVAGDFGGKAETPDWRRAPTSVVALNLRTPTLFTSLAQAGYTVDVSVSAKLMLGNSVPSSEDETAGLGIIGSSQPQAASVFGNDNWSKEYGALYFESGWWTDAGWANNGKPLSRNLMNLDRSYPHLDGNMSYLTIAIYRPSEWHSFSGSTAYVFADDTTITFTVTLTNPLRSDGKAPRAELASAVDASYITAGNIGNYAQGELIGSIGQIAGAPVLSNNHVDLTAGATRKGSINVDEVGGVDNKYAKKVQFSLTEMTANNTDASVDQPTYYAGLAGITVGSITSQTSTIYNSSYTHGAFTYSATEGTGNGYYHWAVSDAGRTQGVLTLYFNDNVSNLEVRVYDSGGTALTLTVTVGGIKTGGDTLSPSITDGTRMKDESSASFDGLTWEWNDLVPTFKNMGGGADAQIWFYAVRKSTNATDAAGADALFPAKEGNSGITPIGFTDADGRWTAAGGLTTAGNSGFDFTKGLLYGVAPVNGGSATGSGYYRFEF